MECPLKDGRFATDFTPQCSAIYLDVRMKARRGEELELDM
jgi:hypothetical protein